MPILGEGEQPALRARYENPLQIIVLEPLHPGQWLSGRDTAPIEVHRNSLHEPLVADGDHRIFIGNRVFHLHLVRLVILQKDCPPRIPILFNDLVELLEHDLELSGLTLEYLFESPDEGPELLESPLQFCLLERSQFGESHVENGVCLNLRESEKVLELLGGL